ncbi:hypothetical protein [Gordonia sp. N1V]|uniref:hypothetical protein n=1 Tax=Gordonia sp. N1V TaxID=3034163 RepID=UPI0023E23B0B|nr:hypothetical protein [Gordonia sp. N1V]MDF3280498.1 hypothetical protein [Gordonia sp. N1V]
MRYPGSKPEITEEVAGYIVAALYKIFPDVIDDIIEILTGIEDGDTDDLGTWINNLKTLLSGGTVTGGAGFFEGLSKLPGFGDLIEIITGIEDGDTDDLGTWINGLKTILSGGTVTGLPTLGGALNLGGLQTMLQQIADILNGLVVTPINSAVQGVKDWFAGLVGWRSTTDTNVATATSNAASASSAASAAQTASNQIAQNINNAISGGAAAGTGAIAQAFDTVASIFGLAGAASATATAVATQAAQSAAQQNANAAKGVSNSVVFFGSDGAALPTVDWTDDGSGNIVIRGSAGRAGIKSGAADGTYGKQFNYPTATPNQSIIVVVGEKVNDPQDEYLLCRIDAGFTRGGYVRYDESGVTLGRFAKSGTTYSWTAWASQSRAINPGDMIEYCCIDATYYVHVNRVLVLTYTDSSATLSYGTTTLYGGFAMSRYTVPLLGIVNDAFRLASFSLSDKAGSVVIGIGWRLHRAATSTTSSSGSGTALSYNTLPVDVFDTTVNTSQVTVTNQARGTVTIQRSGFYQIIGALSWGSGTQAIGYVVFVNGSRATDMVANDTATWLYLNAGDTCQIGWMRPSGATTSQPFRDGGPGGGSLHFGGFLMQTAS